MSIYSFPRLVMVIGICAGPIAGCSADSSTPAALPSRTAPNSAEALQDVAHRLDVLASTGQTEAAWDLYSQRCKNQIGDLGAYRAALAVFFEGRNPQYESATARVNGSSGQVVSVDKDPSAPASSMAPRTWTFIDGRWQFDNC